MNVVIIEDETPARERLTELLTEVMPETNVVTWHETVKSAGKWFSQNPLPDLILLDVQLADGTAFDLLELVKIDCPIIFTTAYSKYAINAFKAKSIDYLLKPVKKAELSAALQKLQEFKQLFTAPGTAQPRPDNTPPASYRKRFMIRFGEHIKTILTDDIAYCYSENKNTYARTTDGRTYPMDHNLDMLEAMLDPADFFRVNRQYIITLKAITEMKTYSKARVIINLAPEIKEQPVVSSERAAEFKRWLDGEVG